MKRALVTGVTGQDGYYLSQLLRKKKYWVYGLVRRNSHPVDVPPGVEPIVGDMSDQGSLNRAVIRSQPDEVYNLAAQSFVGASWSIPTQTADITGMGTLRLLEAVRTHKPDAKFYQASSSEMFGSYNGLADEYTPFRPKSPYGVAKVFAHQIAVNYRDSYDMFVSCGIMFNHESPKRGVEFVTQKIVQGVKSGSVTLGDINPRRDWGYAKEYVKAMWLMLQQEVPDDFVIATGVSHSIKDFLDEVCRQSKLNPKVRVDDKLKRPSEIYDLKGDSTKAGLVLGWEPKIDFKELVRIMVEEES